MRTFRVLGCLAALFVVVVTQPARAQDDPNFETGIKPFGSYQGGNIDNTGLLNGDTTLDIPLISYPQRGGKLALSFVLHYANLGTYEDVSCPYGSYCVASGPAGYMHGFAVIEKDAPSVGGGGILKSDMSGDTLLSEVSTNTSPYQAVDGSGFHIATSGTASDPIYVITDPNGIQYTSTTESLSVYWPALPILPSLREDTNGNQISWNSTSGYVDTMGRTIPVSPLPMPTILMSETISGQTTVFSTSCAGLEVTTSYTLGTYTDTETVCDVGATQNYSGCSGPLTTTSATIWNPPGPNGGTYPIKLCFAQVSETIPANIMAVLDQNSLGAPPATYTGNLLQSVVLPNGTTWTFTYTTDGHADLAQVTFPTGGTLAYTWTSPAVSGSVHDAQFTRGVATRTLNPNDGITPPGTWTYAYTAPSGTTYPSTVATTVTDPAGNSAVHTFTTIVNSCPSGSTPPYCPPPVYYETQAQYMSGSASSGTVLKTVNTAYANFTPFTSCNIPQNENPPFWAGIFPTMTTTKWSNGQENEVTHTYDNSLTVYTSSTTRSFGPCVQPYGRVLTTSEYDYGSGAPGALLRTTTTSYTALNSSAYMANNLLSLPASVTIAGAGPGSITTFTYDGSTPASSGITTQVDPSPPFGTALGNLTSVARYLNTSGSYLTSNATYFNTGEIRTATDPKGNSTTHGYSSMYVGAYPTTTTNALGQIITIAYDFNTGLVTSVTDANSQTTSYSYDDMLRATQVIYPDGGQTFFSYPNTNQVNITEAITSSANRLSYLLVDGLGREIREAVTNGESTAFDEADTCYDALGRVSFKSYPFQDSGPFATARSCASPELGDAYAYEPLNRTSKITHTDGSLISASYSGNSATSTDEQSKTHETFSDGLGRQSEVIENPGGLNYTTTYTHDVLGDLTGVTQAGSRQRTFVYDSLARLTSATNPERGTVTSTYDADGNLLTKVDARGITSTYTYDVLNRVTGVSYSDGTATEQYVYDTAHPFGTSATMGNPVGRLVGATSSGANRTQGYDSMGRVIRRSDCLLQTFCDYTATQYNLLGSATQITYPLGLTVNYTYNAGNRPTSAVDSNSVQYVTNAHYNAAGSLCSEVLGTTITQTLTFNGRIQPLELQATTSGAPSTPCATPTQTGNLLDLSYNFNYGSGDNGNVMGITNNRDTTRSQTFAYDALNRLSTAETASTYSSSPSHCWGESYVYDNNTNGGAWGNLTNINVASTSYNGCTQEALSQSVTGNNQFSGFCYDAAGNLLAESAAPCSSPTYSYNAKNQLTSTAGVTYTYEPLGARVAKSTGPMYWYGPDAQVLEEDSLSGSPMNVYVYFAGQRAARVNFSNVTLPIQNASFQTANPLTTSCGTGCAYNTGPIPDWTQVAAAGSFQPNSTYYTSVPVGSIVAYSTNGTISQTLTGVSLQPNSTYTLSVYVGSRLDGYNGSYSIELEAGSTVLATATGSSTTFPLGSWVKVTLTYTTSGTVTSGNLGIVLANTGGDQSNFSDVQLSVTGGTVYYYAQDMLGTSRTIVQAGQTTPCYDADFYPFGSERAYTNTCPQNYKFTGKERDSESNLDNSSARYESSGIGRFMSPDPMGNYFADGSYPQTWNMYSYASNSPLTFTDPSGLDCVYLDNNGGTNPDGPGGFSVDTNSNFGECQQHGGTWINWSITDPSQVQADPNSNWVTVKMGPGSNGSTMLAAGCNLSGGDCSTQSLEQFANSMSLIGSITVTSTGPLYMTAATPSPASVREYIPLGVISWSHIPTRADKLTVGAGCSSGVSSDLLNAKVPLHAAASTDVPEGHMSGQQTAQPRTSPTNSVGPPLNSSQNANTVNAAVGGVGMVDNNVQCTSDLSRLN
jgi:RHS repeat-associated protein